VAIVIFLIAFPFLPLSSYFTTLLTQVLIFTIFTMGVNIIAGYIGLPSMGHAALFGSGAYSVAILAVFVSKNMWLSMTTGILVASSLAAVFALISLRTPGIYFLFITLAMGQVVWAVLFGWRSVTGGDDGMPGAGNPEIWPSVALSSGTSQYYLALFFFVLGSLIMYRIIKSAYGHAIVGIRENEPRMKHLGYNVWLHKFITFMISGAFSGLAGVLWAYYNGFVSPSDVGFDISAEALLIVILGGGGTFFGPLVGTIVIVLIKNIVAAYTKRWLFILGLTYIFTILFAPKGIVGALQGTRKRM
jgi:branched-chain amino acid transport system permease protein